MRVLAWFNVFNWVVGPKLSRVLVSSRLLFEANATASTPNSYGFDVILDNVFATPIMPSVFVTGIEVIRLVKASFKACLLAKAAAKSNDGIDF